MNLEWPAHPVEPRLMYSELYHLICTNGNPQQEKRITVLRAKLISILGRLRL